MNLEEIPIGDTIIAFSYDGKIRSIGCLIGCLQGNIAFLFHKNQHKFIHTKETYFLSTRLVLIEKSIRHIKANENVLSQSEAFELGARYR